VHQALSTVATPGEAHEASREPAVSIRRSITPDYLICLEDGRKFKSLKRHLRTKYDLSPEQYRARWDLPKDYPMVAPNYAQARSELAKQMGLGQGGRKPARRGRGG
jgi:predicted transcriptional regulator